MATDFAKEASLFTSHRPATIFEQLTETNTLGHHSHGPHTACPYNQVIDGLVSEKSYRQIDITGCSRPSSCLVYSHAADFFISAVLLKTEHKKHFEENSTVVNTAVTETEMEVKPTTHGN